MSGQSWRTRRSRASSAERSRGALAAGLLLVVVLGVAGTASAVPPPPPNPSDSEIESSRQQAEDTAGEVGSLTNRLSSAEAELREISDDVAVRRENANKALVDLRTAQDAASRAERDARAARVQADAAGRTINRARGDLDDFAVSSLRQGRTVGSVTAFIGAKNPSDVLQRAGLLNAVGESKLNALDQMQRARTKKANADSAARLALRNAERKQAAAQRAKTTADTAKATAISAQQTQQSRTDRLQSTKSDLESQLAAARGQVGDLQAQRSAYLDWQEQKEAEDAAAAAAASGGSSPGGSSSGGSSAGGSSGGGSAAPPAPTGDVVEDVIARAMSTLGTTYAWGGGDANGPTYGIRDGGVADSYGDYAKIGYDCSGLMIYAFAAAGISLEHYSGYQYSSGPQVPISEMQRGDMLFWGSPTVHHVALYLGDGQMIEAPQSGSYVQISPVRYDGIMPYATRLL